MEVPIRVTPQYTNIDWMLDKSSVSEALSLAKRLIEHAKNNSTHVSFILDANKCINMIDTVMKEEKE